MTCTPSARSATATAVTVTVTGHFTLLTPILTAFTGGPDSPSSETRPPTSSRSRPGRAQPIARRRRRRPSPTPDHRRRRRAVTRRLGPPPSPSDAPRRARRPRRPAPPPLVELHLQPAEQEQAGRLHQHLDADERVLRHHVLALGLRRHHDGAGNVRHGQPRLPAAGPRTTRSRLTVTNRAGVAYHPHRDDDVMSAIVAHRAPPRARPGPRRVRARDPRLPHDPHGASSTSAAASTCTTASSEAAREIARATSVHPGDRRSVRAPNRSGGRRRPEGARPGDGQPDVYECTDVHRGRPRTDVAVSLAATTSRSRSPRPTGPSPSSASSVRSPSRPSSSVEDPMTVRGPPWPTAVPLSRQARPARARPDHRPLRPRDRRHHRDGRPRPRRRRHVRPASRSSRTAPTSPRWPAPTPT